MRAEGRHQRDVDNRIEDNPTFRRQTDRRVEVLRHELSSRQGESPAESAGVFSTVEAHAGVGRAHVRTRSHISQSCFLQKLREKKDWFHPKRSQFQHLPVWVNLTRIISFVFSLLYYLFPSQTQKFREKCF